MQGIIEWIPTARKVEYLNTLLQVGFPVLDFGSFVSEKAIPQLKDTAEVLDNLQITATKLLAIVANERGADQALLHSQIDFIGFPLSLSETFQVRNTNKSIAEAWEVVQNIQEKVTANGKRMVIYFSMGFGNPYGDVWHTDIVEEWAEKVSKIGIEILSLSDTMGQATATEIAPIFQKISSSYPDIEVGVHLHSAPQNAMEKIGAAYDAGCRRFDGALLGIGGCPMAGDALVGNIDTRTIIQALEAKGETFDFQTEALKNATMMAGDIFSTYH